MLRGIAAVFVIGWLAWFWVDKAAPPYPFVLSQPAGDDLIRDLQFATDLVKSGAVGPAFVFAWRHHYILLSAVLGIAGALLFRGMGTQVGRAIGGLKPTSLLRTRRSASVRGADEPPSG